MQKYRLDFERIKQEFKIIDVAREFGLELHRENVHEWRCVSTAEDSHNTTALSIDTDQNVFNDFKQNEAGSVLDFVALVKFGRIDKGTIYQAAEFLAGDKYVVDGKDYNEWRQMKEDFITRVKTAHERLMSDDTVAVYTREYLHERGISDDTLKKYLIGLADMPIQYGNDWIHEPRLIIPYLDRAGVPFYACHRRIDKYCHDVEKSPKYKKLYYPKEKEAVTYIHNGIWGYSTIPERAKAYERVNIAEGAFDALSFAQDGFIVLSPITGVFSGEQIQEVISICKNAQEIVTTFDNDEKSKAGIGFTVKFGKTLFEAGLTFRNVSMNAYGEGHKDVSDYYSAGGNLQELVTRHTECGAVFVARYLNAEFDGRHYDSLSFVQKKLLFKSVREFLNSVKKLITKDELEAVLAEIRKYMRETDLAEALKAPSEKEVLLEMRDAFLIAYPHLFFHGEIKTGSYYNYDSKAGYWRMVTEAQLRHYISARFLDKLTPEQVVKIASAVAHVRTLDTDDDMPEFNDKPLISFRNGILELDTGEFRAHKPEDYVTYALEYDYDKTADCQLFKKFLNEVTDGNESRIATIRDMLGYILYSDCRLHKMFILYGGGSNGKSVLCNTVAEVFGGIHKNRKSAFCTGVTLSEMASLTSRIRLMNSRLNISAETEFNVRDKSISETLKSLVAGDIISGNYKFRDVLDFQSRAKLFFCCNRLPVIQDNSYGMKRRLIFIEFVRKFIENKNAVSDLEQKLMAELAGIFNYIYQCYKELRERNYIRTCCDQDKLMREFSSNASTVYSFYDSYRHEYSGQEIPVKTVWKDYKDWCEDSLIPNPEIAKNFQTEFRKLIEAEGSKRKRMRKNGTQEYYYVFATLTDTETETDSDTQPQPEVEAVYQPEPSETFTQEELDAIAACNEEFEGLVNDTVKRYVREGLLIQTLEYYMKFLSMNEALALDKIFSNLNRDNEAEIARKIWTTKRNAQERA